jgi:cytoplasmic iron level regulating protein YaaA (DUF328/UPF0246 family)
MIVLLSPAKTLDFTTANYEFHTKPRMLKDSSILINELKTKSSKDLQDLMKVSVKIADLNVERFHSFKTPFNTKNSKPSILAFKGDVYTGLQAEAMNETDFEFAQEHLRILSGLYGILRPMDLMQAYRLEMGTRLKNENGKNLYEFWNDKITKLINKDLKASKGNAIINLASKEYFNAVKPKELKGELYHVNFKEERNGVYKIISFNAKKARGVMSRYIIKNRITNPEEIKGFNEDNYTFSPDLSSEKDWIFTR